MRGINEGPKRMGYYLIKKATSQVVFQNQTIGTGGTPSPPTTPHSLLLLLLKCCSGVTEVSWRLAALYTATSARPIIESEID